MRRTSLVLSALVLASLACALLGGGGGPTPDVTDTPEGKPTVVIDAPPGGAEVAVGQEVFVQSTSNDSAGVARVVLQADGVQVSSDESPDPEGQPTFTLLQSWTPSAAGSHTLMVTAYRSDGTASDPATITLNVVESLEQVQATLPPPPMLVNLAPTTTSGPCQNIIRQQLNVRDGPTTSNNRLGTVNPGAVVNVSGRNSDGSWRYVSYSGGQGWISAGQQYSYSSGDCSNLQVVSGGGGPSGTQGATQQVTQGTTQEVPTQATQDTNQYAPPDNDHFWTVGRDDGTAQFSEQISYPDGDTQDKIFFEIGDLNQGIGAQFRNVQFALVCTGTGTENVRWGTGAQVHNLQCGASLPMSFTYDSNQVLIVVEITSGGYALVNYTIVAVITS